MSCGNKEHELVFSLKCVVLIRELQEASQFSGLLAKCQFGVLRSIIYHGLMHINENGQYGLDIQPSLTLVPYLHIYTLFFLLQRCQNTS